MTLPLPFLANSVAPSISHSNSCYIIKSAKVSYSAEVDGPTSANSPDPACSRMVGVGGDNKKAVVITGNSVVAVGGIVVGGMGGIG